MRLARAERLVLAVHQRVVTVRGAPRCEPIRWMRLAVSRQLCWAFQGPSLASGLRRCAAGSGQSARVAEATAAFQTSKALHGERHEETLNSMGELCFALLDSGEKLEAVKVMRQLLWSIDDGNSVGTEKLVGILGLKCQLAITLGDLADEGEAVELHAEATALLRQAYQTSQHVFGERHSDTLNMKETLACQLTRSSISLEAVELHRGVLQTRRAELGERSPETLSSMVHLSLALHRIGLAQEQLATGRLMPTLVPTPHLSEAFDILRDVLRIRMELHGDRHPETLNSMRTLGALLHTAGAYQEAAEVFQQELDLRTEIFGELHAETVAVADRLRRAARGEP